MAELKTTKLVFLLLPKISTKNRKKKKKIKFFSLKNLKFNAIFAKMCLDPILKSSLKNGLLNSLRVLFSKNNSLSDQTMQPILDFFCPAIQY